MGHDVPYALGNGVVPYEVAIILAHIILIGQVAWTVGDPHQDLYLELEMPLWDGQVKNKRQLHVHQLRQNTVCGSELCCPGSSLAKVIDE